MSVLITRAEPGAARTATELVKLGVTVVCAPVVTVRFADRIDAGLAGVQALAFTSANGVRAWAARREERDLPVLTVGQGTAAAARAAGFADVISADGDAEALAGLAVSRLDPAAGALLHVRGAHVAGDLAARLGQSGFEARETIAYEAKAATRLSGAARAALAGGALRAVMFHSPRGAAIFTALTDAAGLTGALAGLAAIAISPAAAAALRPSGWRDIRIAASPDDAALRACVGEVLREP